MNPVNKNGALKYCQNSKLATPAAAFSGSLEYIMVCKTMFEAVGVHPSMRKMSQKVWSVPFVDGKAELLIFLKRKYTPTWTRGRRRNRTDKTPTAVRFGAKEWSGPFANVAPMMTRT